MGDQLALEFTETFRGMLARSASAADSFSCQVNVRLPDLHPLGTADSVTAMVSGGRVEWAYLGTPANITGGAVELFRRPQSPGEPTTITYLFTFSSGGTEYTFRGEKALANHTASAADELCTVQATIDSAQGIHAVGALSCQLDELLHAYEEAALLGASAATDIATGLDQFHQFLNDQLQNIYKLPALLGADRLLTEDLWRLVAVLAEVLLPSPLPAGGPAISDVVAGIKGFLQKASGKEVQQIRTLLQIIGIFIPILELEVDKIRELVRSIVSEEKDSPIREALAGIHQIVVFAYYADDHADKMLGYVRPVHQAAHHTHFKVANAVPKDRVFDVVIAGTGPAGSLLADSLSSRGKSVLLLEAGPYIPEDQITTNELDSIARLYKSSGLQIAGKPSSITVLQGACVGGGGVINNGIFFPLPAATLQTWQEAGFPFSSEKLWEAYGVVASDLNIGDVKDKAQFLNPASNYLEHRFGKAQAPPLDGPVPPGFYRMLLNLETRIGDDTKAGCRSTGLCNLGCGSERKVNSYQHYLANALLDSSRDVVLVPNASVVKAVMGSGNSTHHVDGLRVQMADGSTALARGKEFILCCGPVGSSGVLLRSDELRKAATPGLPIGKRFCANVASPVFAVVPTPINDHTSVQMTHFYVPPAGGDGFVLETWFSPPGGLALAMPGFLEDHAQRMSQYQKLISASAVVGTQPTGAITLSGDDTVIDLPLAPVDLDRFRHGTILLVSALLDSVDAVNVRFGNGRVIKTPADLDKLDKEMAALKPNDLFLLPMSTAHPQGGNALSDDPSIGVVGADFRVRGIENLRVCDGSVFPVVASVNPQWTIFALAHLCAAAM
ncbi:MAG TPA: GMC oxidoreductase [Bryobacteraceae bacterium]|nr:GMC oxidoreductase [Bryobacteraceae bacterium]